MADTGMGISGGVPAAYAFDKFRQADASFTRHGTERLSGSGWLDRASSDPSCIGGLDRSAGSAGEGAGAAFVVTAAALLRAARSRGP